MNTPPQPGLGIEADLDELQCLIDEGLASGVSARSMSEILQEARTRAGVRPEQDG